MSAFCPYWGFQGHLIASCHPCYLISQQQLSLPAPSSFSRLCSITSLSPDFWLFFLCFLWAIFLLSHSSNCCFFPPPLPLPSGLLLPLPFFSFSLILSFWLKVWTPVLHRVTNGRYCSHARHLLWDCPHRSPWCLFLAHSVTCIRKAGEWEWLL